jgi:2,4-dienoyl-CoA reductase-like NADH-dependent reductase (Old Yellow Enzyme family)
MKANPLFTPLTINGMTLRNRFVRSATYDGLAERNGCVSPAQLGLFRGLAEGGVGLIVTGIAYVHPSGQISPTQNSLASDDCIPSFAALAKEIHGRGSRIAVQLFHGGRETAKSYAPGRRHALAPSVIKGDPYFHKPHRAMGEEDIRTMIQAFGDAARRAKEAGVDAVQVHGAHAYLLSQFLSPFTNQREDRWGGSLQNRLRLHQEIYRTIRSEVGPDFPVLIKIGVQDGFPGGLTFREGKEAARRIARWGYDALEVSSGLRGPGYDNAEFKPGIRRREQEAYFRSWCREIKAIVSAPVMMVGGLRTLGLMAEVVQNREADLVSLCRPLVREPGLIRTWEKDPDYRPGCTSCNRCLATVVKGGTLACVPRKPVKKRATRPRPGQE